MPGDERLSKLEWPPASYMGLGFFQAWAWLLFLSPVLVPSGGEAALASRTIWIANLVVSQVVWLYAVTRSSPSFSFGRMKACRVGVSLLMAAGILVLAIVARAAAVNWPLLVFGAALAGVGTGAVPVMWGELYGAAGARKAAVAASASSVLGVLIYLAVVAIPFQGVRVVFVMALPLLGAIALGRARRHAAPIADAAAEAASTPGFPIPLALIAAGYGLTYGLIVGMVSYLGSGALASPGWVSVLAGGIAAALLLFGAIVFGKHLDVAGYTFRPVLPIMAVGLVLLPFASVANLAAATVMSGFIIFDVVMFAVLADVAFRLRYPALRIFALGRSAAYGGILAGVLLGNWFARAAGLGETQLLTISLIALYVLMLTMALALNERSVGRGWGLIRETPPVKPAPEPPRVPGCNEVIAEYGLSEREGQVLALLAEGRNLEYVRRALNVSLGTTKSDVHDIYAKVGVHSRQALLDQIERCARGEGR